MNRLHEPLTPIDRLADSLAQQAPWRVCPSPGCVKSQSCKQFTVCPHKTKARLASRRKARAERLADPWRE